MPLSLKLSAGRRRFLRTADAVLFGSAFGLRSANRKVQGRLEGCTPDDFAEDLRLGHEQETLDKTLASSISRLERVEDKAKGTLVGVAIAVAVLGAAAGIVGPKGILVQQPAYLRVIGAVVLAAAISYLFGSGHLALQAYKIGAVYAPTLEDQVPLVDSKQHGRITIFCIEQNWRIGTLRSNRLTAAFTCLRNGLAAVMLLGLLVIISAAIAEPAVP